MSGQRPIVVVIDYRRGDGGWGAAGVWGRLTTASTAERVSVRSDGEVKEMITGVRNDQFVWMYAMGFGVPRAPGSAHGCLFRMDLRRFFVDSVFFSRNWP